MKTKTMGQMIAQLRKDNNMTQLELAEKMGVTDKAVSKWERDLSCPDVNSIPKLAELLGVSVEELLQSKGKPAEESEWGHMLDMCLKAVPLAMGIALTITSILKKDLDIYSIAGFAGIGLFAISLYQLRKDK